MGDRVGGELGGDQGDVSGEVLEVPGDEGVAHEVAHGRDGRGHGEVDAGEPRHPRWDLPGAGVVAHQADVVVEVARPGHVAQVGARQQLSRVGAQQPDGTLHDRPVPERLELQGSRHVAALPEHGHHLAEGADRSPRSAPRRRGRPRSGRGRGDRRPAGGPTSPWRRRVIEGAVPPRPDGVDAEVGEQVVHGVTGGSAADGDGRDALSAATAATKTATRVASAATSSYAAT